jgi:hypothetical protein
LDCLDNLEHAQQEQDKQWRPPTATGETAGDGTKGKANEENKENSATQD